MEPRDQATEILGLPPLEPSSCRVVAMWRGGHLVREAPRAAKWVVGRGADADLRIDDASVSRRHATLFFDAPPRIQDHDSANGTWVNGVRLGPGEIAPLAPGSVVEVGVAALFLRSAGERPASAAAPGDAVVREPSMVRAYELAEVVAKSKLTVLVIGETGVGKELLARRIHAASPRAERKLLTLNCAALTETLLESELFGHEKGAFTGATSAKIGLIEAADGGTLFLDEVGELSAATQAKLLRVLEERAVTRVGSTDARPVDVRFVCATHRDLQALGREGRFRQDLYFRLDGMTIRLPPLRERPVDLAALAEHFLREAAREAGRTPPSLAPAALERLRRRPWPGNVRELKNVMTRSLLFCAGPTLEADALQLGEATGAAPAGDPGASGGAGVAKGGKAADEERRQQVVHALEACRWNQSAAAKQLGVSRRTLYNWMVGLGLSGQGRARR